MTGMIDSSHLALYVGDDDTLRDEILMIYQEQLEHWLECFVPTMNDEDWYHASHTLKGASRGVGVWAIGDLCEKSESLVGKLENKHDQRKALLLELHGHVETVMSEISKMLTDVAA